MTISTFTILSSKLSLWPVNIFKPSKVPDPGKSLLRALKALKPISLVNLGRANRMPDAGPLLLDTVP